MQTPMRCELISWNTFYRLCRGLARQIIDSGFHPDLIVAVGRGGYVPARVLADHLGLMNLNCLRVEHYRGPHRDIEVRIKAALAQEVRGNQVLVVDDVSDSGDTFLKTLDHIREHLGEGEMKTATVHHKTSSSYTPDFYARKVVKWRWLSYPWAVIEDLCVFLEEMGPLPDSTLEIQRLLESRHGIRVRPDLLEDALRSRAYGAW